MSLSDWLSLASICVLGALSPGPSLAVVLTVTRLRGRCGGFVAALGHGLGVFFYALMAAMSLSYILVYYVGLVQVVQMAGALVLLWIGIRLITATRCNVDDAPLEISAVALSKSFRDGFAIALLNPKTAAFFASVFSVFLDVGQSVSLNLSMASLAGGIDIVVYMTIVFIATTRRVKVTFSKYAGLNNFLLGVLLLFLGAVLFVRILVT